MTGQSIQIDNVGIALVCSRNYKPKVTTRKFKASCGSIIEFSIDGAGAISKIKALHNACKRDCSPCALQTEKAKNLIQSGK